MTPLLTLNLAILSLVICSGPFVAPRYGSVTPRHSPGQGDQQTVFNVNRAEPVSLVARSSTGDLSAHSTRTGPKQPSLKQNSDIKAGPLRLKQLTNTLKIRILSETSILYLIRYASIILTVGLRL